MTDCPSWCTADHDAVAWLETGELQRYHERCLGAVPTAQEGHVAHVTILRTDTWGEPPALPEIYIDGGDNGMTPTGASTLAGLLLEAALILEGPAA
jgi:hypothetical protein